MSPRLSQGDENQGQIEWQGKKDGFRLPGFQRLGGIFLSAHKRIQRMEKAYLSG